MTRPTLLRGARLPARLADLAEPPTELFVHGELPRAPAVAIVGTRHPTEDGETYARHLAGVLAREGVSVLSGGAIGIDSAAHRGALDVGGTTVVVAPCGFDRPYPAQHADLFQEIVDRGGAYVSTNERIATRASFFLRNQILAALAHAIVLVEAPARSGARNATKHARALLRPLFVVLHPPWNARGGAAIVELRLGARPLAGPRELLRELVTQRQYPLPIPALGDPVPPPWLDADLSGQPLATTRDLEPLRVVRAVRSGARSVEEIAQKSGLEARRVERAILTLIENGVLVPGPSGVSYALNPREH